MEKYKWNAIGLSDIRWKGRGEVSTNKWHTFIYHGQRSKYIQGVAFIVNKELCNSILNIMKSSRVISILIKVSHFNCILIITQVYEPASDKEVDTSGTD